MMVSFNLSDLEEIEGDRTERGKDKSETWEFGIKSIKGVLRYLFTQIKYLSLKNLLGRR